MPTIQDALVKAGLKPKRTPANPIVPPLRRLHRGYSVRAQMCQMTAMSFTRVEEPTDEQGPEPAGR